MPVARVIKIDGNGVDFIIEQRCYKDTYYNEYDYYINDERVDISVIEELIVDLKELLKEE